MEKILNNIFRSQSFLRLLQAIDHLPKKSCMYKHTFSGLKYLSNMHGSQEGRPMSFWVDDHIIYHSNHDTSDSGSRAFENMTQAVTTWMDR